MEALSIVAAYRDRWKLGMDHRPLGSHADKAIEAVGERNRARAASTLAFRLCAKPQVNRADAGHAVEAGPSIERTLEI